MNIRNLLLLCLLLLSSLALAQDRPQDRPQDNASSGTTTQSASPEAPSDEASNQASDEASEVPSLGPSLEQAYQREFAFLQTQKRELEARLQAFRERSVGERADLEAEITQLEGELVGLRARAERLDGLVFDAEREVDTARSNVDVLASTLLQADITLEDGFEAPSPESTPTPEDFERLFAAAAVATEQAGAIRLEEGSFFALDGTEVTGQVLRVGQVAAYGFGESVNGALAPAGGGQWKIWESAIGEKTAAALMEGERPSTIGLFAYESLVNEVEASSGKSVLEIIQSGGMIGWIITLLGIVGLVLVVARILFLKAASASTEALVLAVSSQVSSGDRQGAIETLKQFKGATARVLTTAIRNLDREREHLEDVISESLLNESATLNRFGAVIIVIAAVSPLLGLLGTVTGMISTFDVITEFGTGDPKLLSGGISIALVTTQLGLIVAIPLLLIGNVLSGWAERIKDEMEKSALHVVNRYVEGQSAGPSAGPSVGQLGRS